MTTERAESPAKSDLGITLGDLYRLSVEQYNAIAAAGILDEDDPVELLEGWLVCKYGPFETPASWVGSRLDATPMDAELGLTLAWIWRLSLNQYHAMIDAGILTGDDPVELLGGWLIRKMTQKPAHPVTIDLLREAFASQLPAGWYVRNQAPITLSDGEPEPDVALVRGDRRDYTLRHPGPGDVKLVVEVADASLARDRGVKKQSYARAGIPFYWIVNLVERQIEVYTEPTGPVDTLDDRGCRVYGVDETIPLVLDGAEVASLRVQDLLP